MERGNSAGEQAARKFLRARSLRAQAAMLHRDADRAERDAVMWQRGSDGEQLVAAQLELLRPFGFDVFHDVHWPGRRRANIDHIAVGPPGILVVDAKNWSGAVTVRDGALQQNGFRRDKEVAGAKQAAQDVGALLQLPWALHVIPVIALADSTTGSLDQCEGVTVLGQADLVGWATRLEHRLTAGDVVGIADHLRTAMPSASVTAARFGDSYRAATTIPREPSARERTRIAKRASARRDALMKLVLVAALLLALPVLLKWWGAHGEDVVRNVIPTPSFSVTTPAPTPSAAQAFVSCRMLRAEYPFGVQRKGAKNAGPTAHRRVAVDPAVYRANKALDEDEDGIACEVTQKGHRAR